MDLVIIRTPQLLKEVFKIIALHENYLLFDTDKDKNRYYIWSDILNTMNHGVHGMIFNDEDHYEVDIAVRMELFYYVESILHWLSHRFHIIKIETLNEKYITIRIKYADKRDGKTKHI